MPDEPKLRGLKSEDTITLLLRISGDNTHSKYYRIKGLMTTIRACSMIFDQEDFSVRDCHHEVPAGKIFCHLRKNYRNNGLISFFSYFRIIST